MGISVSQIYRVRGGKRYINQKFIVGAIKAFPNHKLDDLFYLVPESPTVNNSQQQHSATNSTDEAAIKEKAKSIPPAPEGSPQLPRSIARTSTAQLVPP